MSILLMGVMCAMGPDEDVNLKPSGNGFFQRLNDWIFGYDFFISYAHRDGTKYPDLLREHLQSLGFKSFLDKNEYVAGIDLRQATRRRVRMSQKLILVGRPAAFLSEWVRREVEVHIQAGKTPILININQSVEHAPKEAVLAGWALHHHWLRIEEQLPEGDSPPTDQCIKELCRSFDASRIETRRSRFFGMVAVAFALIAVIAVWQANRAATQRDRAERVLDRVTTASNNLVFDLAQQFRGQLGIPQALIIKILGQAKALVEELAKAGETRPDILESRGVALAELSAALRSQGNMQEALAAAETAVSMFERLTTSGNTELKLESSRATGYDRLGDVFFELGDYERALSAYDKSFLLSKKLVESNESQDDWQRSLAVSYEKIADVHLTKRRLAEASEGYLRSKEIRKRLVDKHPDHTDRKRDLAVSYAKVARVYRSRDDRLEALRAYQQSLTITEEIAAAHPRRADWQRDVAVNYQEIGDVLTEGGRLDKALDYYRKDVGITERLHNTDPQRVDWMEDLVKSYDRTGEAFRKLGKLTEALAAYQRSLILAAEVASRERGRVDWRKTVSAMYQKVAWAYLETGQPSEALRIAEESVTTMRQYSGLGANAARDLAFALNNVAWYALFSHAFQKALQAAEEAINLAPHVLAYKINKAHAILLLDRTEDARPLYLAHTGDIMSDGVVWERAVRNDFAALRVGGLYHPAMDQIEAQLGK